MLFSNCRAPALRLRAFAISPTRPSMDRTRTMIAKLESTIRAVSAPKPSHNFNEVVMALDVPPHLNLHTSSFPTAAFPSPRWAGAFSRDHVRLRAVALLPLGVEVALAAHFLGRLRI